MQATRDLAEIVEHRDQPLPNARQLRSETIALGEIHCLCCAQLQCEGEELLLGTVVQVAFEPPPCRVGGRHDARDGTRRARRGSRHWQSQSRPVP